MSNKILEITNETNDLTRGVREQGLAKEILEIGSRCAALPDLDSRSADEILGYNEFGGG